MDKNKGIDCMILSAFGFAVMQILIALTAKRIPVFEQMLFRNLITTGIAYAALRKKGASPWGERANRPMLLARSVLGFLGMLFLFSATAAGNQGEVAILTKLSPFVVILCAMVLFKERPTRSQTGALVLALCGAAVTAGFHAGASALPAVLALLSSVFAGAAYFCVGALKGKEEPQVIVFVFSAFTTALTGAVTLFQFVMPSPRDLLLLVGIGLMAAVGQIGLTYAYSYAKASEVSVFNYSGIPFAMLLGALFLRQPVTVSALAGSVLVILAGVISFLGERRA